MSVLSFTLLSVVSVVAVLIGYGAIRKERSSGQLSQQLAQAPSAQTTADNAVRQTALQQSRAAVSEIQARIDAIVRKYETLKIEHQQAKETNHALQQQIETLISEKVALKKNLDQTRSQMADLEAQLAQQAIEPEQITHSKSDNALAAETSAPNTLAETLPPILKPKPSAPLREDASNADISGHTPSSDADASSEVAKAAQAANRLTTDALVKAGVEDLYETEATTTVEKSTHDQAILAEPSFLEGKSIVITGTFVDITPTEIKERIQAVGGRLQGNPNAKTDYIVVGEIPGSKLQLAEKLSIPQLSEEQFLNLLKASERLAKEGG